MTIAPTIRIPAAVIAMALSVSAVPVKAQVQVQPPEPGERVRLQLAGEPRIEGRLVSLTPDSITVVDARGSHRRHARPAVQRLWVTRDSTRTTMQGLRMGALVGFLGGFVLGATSVDQCNASEGCLFDISPVEAGAFTGVVGMLPGAVIGAVIGMTRYGPRWQPVDNRGWRASVTPQADGTVRVQVRLGH